MLGFKSEFRTFSFKKFISITILSLQVLSKILIFLSER